MRTLKAAIMTLTMVLALGVIPEAQAAGVLTFAKKAEVASAKVTLRDLVASANGLDPVFDQRLAKVKVAESPQIGRIARVEGSKLRILLAQANPPRDLSVLIPGEVAISRATQRVTTSQISQAFRKAITERMGARGADFSLHSVSAGTDMVLPAGRLENKVHFLGQATEGLVAAHIEFWVNGSLAGKRRVSGKVDVFGKVAVAARGLSRRHVLAPEDVKVVRLRLNDIQGTTTSDPEELIGLRTRVPVSKGEALELNRLERAPLIRRGDVVRMVYTAGRLKVSAKGRAEQTGYKGGSIKLVNLASKREVYGKVLDAGTVLVEF
jgi:flagella basal body P-ring formation protein FlgA